MNTQTTTDAPTVPNVPSAPNTTSETSEAKKAYKMPASVKAKIKANNQFKKDIEKGGNPRDIKFKLAEEIIERFHDKAAAETARENFIARFQKGAMPDEMPELEIKAPDGKLPIGNLLKEATLVKSTSDALRMIKQGAVKIDGERIDDNKLEIPSGEVHVFQVGKRKYARVTLV